MGGSNSLTKEKTLQDQILLAALGTERAFGTLPYPGI